MSRWITVANRLPFTLNLPSEEVKPASGGLVSALSGVKSRADRHWVGGAPDGLAGENWSRISSRLKNGDGSNDWTYHPVYVEKGLYASYYNGFCNDVLWPLLHYQTELVTFDTEAWESYRRVNELFAEAILDMARPGDLLWIHDFHLFLLPKLLKTARPELRIGFFLHVPFPSSEIFRQLPWRDEILDSLLASDLIGFHDYSYLQHFSSSVLRLLGRESGFMSIRTGRHECRLGVFPVSIDTDMFMKKSRDPKVRAIAKKIERPHFTFLGVDRLDYMKGLDLKLKAFREFFRRFPHAREHVSLIQVAVPTRQGVPAFTRLARDTACLVGEINGEYSTANWHPIHYLHSSVGIDELVALYRSADALVVSSKRDGMNLVALEFIAAQDRERPGVVLLSEFAGASSTLSHAVMVNPWSIDEMTMKLQLAIEMPRQEKLWRAEQMQMFLKKYDASDWAESFVAELDRPGLFVDPRLSEIADARSIAEDIQARGTRRVLLLLDYDGTLVPIARSPEMATLDHATRENLVKLLQFPWLRICIISGRDKRFLARELDGLDIMIAAEHGAKILDPRVGRWKSRVHSARKNWYPSALKIMQDYALRVPGSQVEKKQFSVSWHYRQSPSEYGEIQARKLAQELEQGFANLPVNVLRGKKVIEVRTIEANKGVLTRELLDSTPPQTIAIAIGDDQTDEEMFGAIQSSGISIKIGTEPSLAHFHLPGQKDLAKFLKDLSNNLSKSHELSMPDSWPHRFLSMPVGKKTIRRASLSDEQRV